jgi:hypothetical protein
VSTSTMDAEYVALSKAAKYFVLLKTTLKDLQFLETLMVLFCDNHSAIDHAENHRISELSTHIDIYHHYVRELFYDKTFPLIYNPTKDN